MGRADNKDGEGLLSEADEEKDKGTSDIDDPEYESKKKYKCTEPGCAARFLRPSRLTWHLRKHNDERPYKCDREGCTRAYTNSSHLKRHQNSHQPVTKSYQCEHCPAIVGSLFSLKRHLQKIHDPTRLTCEECGMKFRKKHCYTEHLSMHAGVSLYDCEDCHQQFRTLRLLKKHQLIHEKLKSYPCKSPGCSEIFNQWSKLVKHVETQHEFGHACSKCDKKFKNKRQLSLHETVHANEGIVLTCPYENCPRFYSFEKNLDEHIATFHLGRIFTCDICEATLTSKASIIRHIKYIHEGLKKPMQRRKRLFRRRRYDAGIPKKSMAAKLAGLKLPKELEQIVLMREPKIILNRIETNVCSTTVKSAMQNETEIAVRKYLEEYSFEPVQTEEEISASANSLLQTGRLVIFENSLQDSDEAVEQNNLKAGSLLNNDLQKKDSNILLNNILQNSCNSSKQTDQILPAVTNVVDELLGSDVETILEKCAENIMQIQHSTIVDNNVNESHDSNKSDDKKLSLVAEDLLKENEEMILEMSVENVLQTWDSIMLKDNLHKSPKPDDARTVSLVVNELLEHNVETILENSAKICLDLTE